MCLTPTNTPQFAPRTMVRLSSSSLGPQLDGESVSPVHPVRRSNPEFHNHKEGPVNGQLIGFFLSTLKKSGKILSIFLEHRYFKDRVIWIWVWHLPTAEVECYTRAVCDRTVCHGKGKRTAQHPPEGHRRRGSGHPNEERVGLRADPAGSLCCRVSGLFASLDN